MKFFKDKTTGEVFAYELDGSQDHHIGDKISMSDAEVQAHLNPPKSEEQVKIEVVSKRNSLLYSSDWTQLPDSPLSETLKKKWVTYRQELRDLTSQKDFPYEVTWPKEPK